MSEDTNPDPKPDGLLLGIMTVKRVMKYDLQTGFTIVNGTTERTGPKGMTFIGVFSEYPEVGQVFCVKGKFGKNPKYNPPDFFKVEFARPQETKTEAGWVEYLLKECPRIGEMRSVQLVKAYGTNVLDKLAEGLEPIMQCPEFMVKNAFSQKEAEQIHAWAKQEQRLSRMKAWLYEKGLGRALVAKIVGRYKQRAPTVVRNEPYSLTEIDGIAFLTADKIARAVKIPPDDPMRIQAALLYMMQQRMEDGGHTCITRHELLTETQTLLGVHQQAIEQQIDLLLSSGKLCNDQTDVRTVSRYPFLFEEIEV